MVMLSSVDAVSNVRKGRERVSARPPNLYQRVTTFRVRCNRPHSSPRSLAFTSGIVRARPKSASFSEQSFPINTFAAKEDKKKKTLRRASTIKNRTK